MIELGENRYGKQAIRLVKLVRYPDHHEVRDLTVAVTLEGDFEAVHVAGDNARMVLTDTMKNAVYGLAGEHLRGPIERFGLALAEHFLGHPQVSLATIAIDEHAWRPIDRAGGPAPHAFVRAGDLTRTAVVSADGAAPPAILAGIRDLVVMKTKGSAFSGFAHDRFTTLPETDDRIMASRVTATWSYVDPRPVDFDVAFRGVCDSFLDLFADHDSPSVQASIWIIGRALLERHPEVAEIRMVMPNLHHWAVDLAPFGLVNENEIFVATTEPHGLIDATVRRS